MHNRNLTLESRRTSRVSKLLPVRIRTGKATDASEMVGAWTVVVNRHGARFESKRPFNGSGDVEVTVLATGRTAPGKVIWANPRSNFRDNFEFAIELREPANMWGITFPPEDWNESEHSSSDRLQSVPVPLKSLNPKENKEIVTVFESSSKAKSAGGNTSPMESAESLAPVAMASNVTSMANVAAPVAANAMTIAPSAADRAETARLGQSLITDRLTGIVRELIESAVQIEEEVATDRLIGRMRDQFDQVKQSAFTSFEEKTVSLVSTESARLQERAAEIDTRSKNAVDESLRLITEAKEQGNKSIRDEADASFSVIESLRNDVAQYVKTTETEFIEQCRNRTELVLTESLEAAQKKFVAQMDDLAERMAQRTEKILADTVASMEQRATAAVTDAANRLESQREGFSKSLDQIAEKLLKDITEKQIASAAQAQNEFKAATDSSMTDLRAGLTKMLRGVADAVAVLEGGQN